MSPGFIDEIKYMISSNLPTSSGIIGEIIKTISDSSSNASDLTEVIERDPPLAAKILQVSNSAYYAASSTINTLQRAVVILGFDTIKEIAITASVVHHLFDQDLVSDVDRLGLWIHSVGTAKASQLIAEEIRTEESDKAYTVGLLHDIGKILLVLSFPERYSTIIHLAERKHCRILLAERKVLNIDHTMIGKILCDIWNLPDDISTAILYHHDPMEITKGSQILARIINLGDYMCRKAQIGNPGDTILIKPSNTTIAILGTTPKKIENTFNKIFIKLVDMKEEIESFYVSLE
ncbi:MAG: HDOD domain-containing protein [Candidatus Latescibacteria bacterium]|nr:HDOD domain-containing protein [Candidatus Latescibacterota bacterium]